MNFYLSTALFSYMLAVVITVVMMLRDDDTNKQTHLTKILAFLLLVVGIGTGIFGLIVGFHQMTKAW